MRRTLGLVRIIAAIAAGSISSHDIASAQELPVPEPRFGVAAEAAPRVYASKFETGKADGWSVRSVKQAPKGQWFLGDFNKDYASLRVNKLPPHALLKVTFDLYLINTWDGSGVISAAGGPSGPDMISVDVDGVRNILRATFSNLPDTGNFAQDGKRQTYPWPIPSRSVAGGTGALGIHELGFIYTYNPPGVSFPQDSSYTITATFPHDADEVILDFVGMNLQSIADESWGVANVTIDALPDEAAPILDEAEQARAFERIVSGNVPATARDAFWRLVADGNSTVRYIEKTAAGFGIDQDRVATLVRELDDPAKRDAAVHALADLGPAVEPLLRDAVRENPKRSVDVDRALLMIEITPLEGPHARATATAARLLATIATPEAQRVYAALAAKPSPLQPGTPAYEAEWKERFNQVYRLRVDEHIRLVPKPFSPERVRFNRENVSDPRPSPFATFVARTGSTVDAPGARLEYRASSLVRPAGVGQIANMLGLYGVTVPQSLEAMEFDGDLLVRPRLSSKHAIPAFVRFMEEYAHREVRIDESTIDERVLHVAGAARVEAAAGEAPILEMTAEPLDKIAAPAQSTLRTTTLDQAIQMVVGHQSFGINWDGRTDDRPVRLRVEQMARLLEERDRETLQRVLDNIAAQTGVKFDWKTYKRKQYTLVDLGEIEKK